MNIVLMAGGGGTRLWPLSRKNKPKQFISLGGGKTLLELAYERVCKISDSAHVFVATVKEFSDTVHSLLPQLPAKNILLEPHRRDTAPAIAAAAVRLALKGYEQEPAAFMWSDHIFTNEEEFIRDARAIPLVLEKNPQAVVVMGHVPASAETGLGYIEAGEKLADFNDVYRVKSFKEKPARATAEQYVTAGNYFWNMGAVSASPHYLLEELRKHKPQLMEGIDQFKAALEQGNNVAADKMYGTISPISIDYALLEKTTPIYVVTGDYGWSDVGSWKAIQELIGNRGDHMPRGHHIHVDSHNNFIYNTTEKAVSLIGIDNTVVVVTDDAILVTDQDHTQKVKEVVSRLEETADGKYV
jgi:mannose-1-phosphate guanylyltransferase